MPRIFPARVGEVGGVKIANLYGGDVSLSFDAVKHAYQWQGKFVPGVTSILKLLDKPALIQWAANMAAEFCADTMAGADGVGRWVNGSLIIDRDTFARVIKDAKTAHRKFSKSAADVGTEVHAFCEKSLTEQLVSLPENPQARKGVEAFLGWKAAHKIEPFSCERMVFSRRWYFCGTCDFHGTIDGVPCILDFKTSSGLYLEMLLQLAAYAIALEEELGERINDAWIVRLDKKTGKCQPYHIPLKDAYRDAFLRVREAHELISKIEDDLDGLRTNKAA